VPRVPGLCEKVAHHEQRHLLESIGIQSGSGETLTCKPMGRPASSGEGSSKERWPAVFSLSLGL